MNAWVRRVEMNTSASQSGAPAGQVTVKFLKRRLFQRAFGRCATPEPSDRNCWELVNDQLRIDLKRAPELSTPGGAVRLEGRSLPFRVLIVFSEPGEFRACVNSCTHGGRRLDPVPGTETVQCCSVGKTTFNAKGEVIYGPGKSDLKRLPLEMENDRLVVSLSSRLGSARI
jgi:nitrite reductase/ring-hydroxylating ferredoxin subunit